VTKDRRIELLVTAEQRASYEAEANRAGLSLSAWLRHSADEAVVLANALEAQVEQERVRQKRWRLDVEQVSRPRHQPRPPSPRPHHRRGYVGTIGDALRQADAHHRR
jgi:hypothetical protein